MERKHIWLPLKILSKALKASKTEGISFSEYVRRALHAYQAAK